LKGLQIGILILGLCGICVAEGGLTTDSVYQKNCAKCHGKTAEGRHFGGPSLVAEKATSMPEADVRTMISNGKGRMPKYANKLSAEEIDTLVKEIKAGDKK
jgi:mono/diheme cytochrome c family protein